MTTTRGGTRGGTMGMKMTYRAWVEAGARGFFLSAGVAVNATRLINPLDRRGGYFVRRDTRDPVQRERRALLHERDREDGEREERRALRHERRHSGHRHVIAYDNQPAPDRAPGHPNTEHVEEMEQTENVEDRVEGWILTHRVERPIEVVRRGWLTWETLGEVVTREPTTDGSERR